MSQPRPVVAIIPAAGSGVRMGAAAPKALLTLGGIPLLRRTVETFVGLNRFEHTVVPAPADKIAEFEQILSGLAEVSVIPGGAERQASVRAGISFIERRFPAVAAHGSIMVHDGARCLVSRELIERCLEAHRSSRAVTAAVPVVDTLVRGDLSAGIIEGLDRGGVYSIQTPQLFEAPLLISAHKRGAGGATDDASLVRALAPVHLVEGDRLNIKMTTPSDLAFGEFVLGARGGR